jgi:predicted nucleotide-binding protein with TIR-like domain
VALPIFTTGDDVREIVGYLKNKPTGATPAEGRAVVQRQLDGRKIAAYTFWGIVVRDGERLKLTDRGWELARSKDGGAAVFRAVLDAVPPYRSALEWVHHQSFDTVTNVDVGAQWHEHHAEALGTENENTIKDSAVCFFHICQAAELGTLTIGRHSSPTRLTVDRGKLRAFVEAGPSAPPWVEPPPPTEEDATPSPGVEPEPKSPTPVPPVLVIPPQKVRVFISHSGDSEMVDQVQTMLGVGDMEGEVAEEEETTAIPVPEKVLAAMRRCTAGIIIVSVDERHKDGAGKYTLNPNVLIEIGAAFVLYDRRVVLLWDRRLPVPSNLQGLYRCEFEGMEFSWTAGMKLMKAIKGFKA